MQKINFSITFKDYIQLLYPNCIHGAIFSSEGDIWSCSDGWTFTSEYAKEISHLMDDPQTAMKSKFSLGQRDYLVIYSDYNTLVGRKREFGVMVKKSKMYYVIGFCDGSINPTKCLDSVSRVSKMMKRSSKQPNKEFLQNKSTQ